MNNKEKKIENKSDIKKELEEMKEIMKCMNNNLKILVDFLETRKRISPTSEELFGNHSR